MADSARAPREAHGFLMAIGGNEDKKSDREVLRRLVALPKGGAKHIEVIPTASSYGRSLANEYIDVFRDLGAKDVGVLDIRERRDTEYADYLDRIRTADIVYMTGGDQMRLTQVIGGSPAADALKARYVAGSVIAGTSAGAAAMSSTMIAGGDEGRMRKGSVRLAPGFGFIDNCIIDTHFLDRGRVGRLLEVVASNPGHVGLGVGEDTAVLVSEGRLVEAIGSGVVVVVDGTSMEHTNVSRIRPDEPIAVEGIRVHTLAPGYHFDLKEKKYLLPGK